ncbi:MAG: Flp pilus assembly pilin Flp [Pirellulaceae bacterium]|jgi:Flp pilus assembly pilin Flp
MKSFAQKIWSEEDGMLSFEWTLLVTLLTIGLVSGVAGARDAIIDELGDLAEATICFDQSYTFAGIPALGIDASSYTDTKSTYTDCSRIP